MVCRVTLPQNRDESKQMLLDAIISVYWEKKVYILSKLKKKYKVDLSILKKSQVIVCIKLIYFQHVILLSWFKFQMDWTNHIAR